MVSFSFTLFRNFTIALHIGRRLLDQLLRLDDIVSDAVVLQDRQRFVSDGRKCDEIGHSRRRRTEGRGIIDIVATFHVVTAGNWLVLYSELCELCRFELAASVD